MESCEHLSVSDGACMSCGLCVGPKCDYVSSYTPCTFVLPRKMKYFAADESGKYIRSIESVVGILGVPGYSGEIRHLLQTKKFRHRVGASDKVLAATYHVLRRHQYPISYSDLLPLTEKTAPRFKRILLREFEHVEASPEYLTAIFERVRDSCSLRLLERTPTLAGFISLFESNRSANPYGLCMAYFAGNEALHGFWRRPGLERVMSASSLRKIVKRIGKSCPEDMNGSLVQRRRLRVKDNARKCIMSMLQRGL